MTEIRDGAARRVGVADRVVISRQRGGVPSISQEGFRAVRDVEDEVPLGKARLLVDRSSVVPAVSWVENDPGAWCGTTETRGWQQRDESAKDRNSGEYDGGRESGSD